MSYTPIVICGMGRSGTRNVADNIARHPKVQIYGEIPPQMMDSFLNFYSTVDYSYSRSEFKGSWEKRKEEFFFDCLNNISKEKIELKKVEREYVGYKSPRHEQFFEKIEACFAKSEKKPIYIYCARDALSCWRSYRSMEWNKLSIQDFFSEYISSFNKFFEMSEKYSDRVVVFNLNEYKSCEDKLVYFKNRILKKVGMNDSDLIDFQVDNRNRNATTKVTGKTPVNLPEDEQSLIASNNKIKVINEYFCF